MNRVSLNDLSRIAWQSLKEFMQKTLKIDGMPGGALIIQTHGNLINHNSHIHFLGTDGLFDSKGTFHLMPRYSDEAKKCLQKLFEFKVARYCIDKGYVKEKTIMDRLSWKYTGFSVYIDTKIDFTVYNEEAEAELEQLSRYISKPFYSMNRITYNENGSKVLYKSEYNPGVKQNFETISPTDFIAAITAHIPKHRQKYISLYGWYSNKCRGLRNKYKKSGNEEINTELEKPTEDQKSYRKTWAQLIQQVWEVDPMICPKCSTPMKVIAVIMDEDVKEKILNHLGLWEENKNDSRAPPVITNKDVNIYEEVQHIPFDDGWAVNETKTAVKYAA